MPDVGKILTPFETQTADGHIFRFPHDLQMPFTILVIYRKNACVPCKIQLEYLRDAYSSLLAKGAQIIAISYLPPEESAQITVELKLPYQILCDPEGTVLKILGALNTAKLASGGVIHSGLIFPTILIVDQNGTIRFMLVTKKTATEREFAQINTALEKLRSSV